MKIVMNCVYLVIMFSPVLSTALEMNLKYTGSSSNECSNGLLSGVDNVKYTSEIDNSEKKNPLIEFTIKPEKQQDFESFCVLQIPDDCDKHLDDKCICVSGNRSEHYLLYTSVKAEVSWSKAQMRGALYVDKSVTYSNTETLPTVYDSAGNYALLQNDNTLINTTAECRLTLTEESFAALLYRCTYNSPSPCSLKISDAWTKATLRSNDNYILYSIYNSTIKYLEFSFTICGHHSRAFNCTIHNASAEKETGLSTCKDGGNNTPFIILIVFATLCTAGMIIKVLLWKCLKRKSTIKNERNYDKLTSLVNCCSGNNYDINDVLGNISVEDQLDYIKAEVRLTANIYQGKDHQTSESTEPHAKFIWAGSGTVSGVTIYGDGDCSNCVNISDSKICRCWDCKKSQEAKKALGEIKVTPSNCTVDEKEIHTTYIRFDEGEDSTGSRNVSHELAVESVHLENGVCNLTCYSCEKTLLKKYEGLLNGRDTLLQKTNNKNNDEIVIHETTVLIIGTGSVREKSDI